MIHSKHYSQNIVDSISITPFSFLKKQMNISSNALVNYFKLWLLAVNNFLQGNLIYHDALVGENACHIRALTLIDIAEKLRSESFRTVLCEIVFAVQRIIKLIPTLHISQKETQQSIEEFLRRNHLFFFIPSIYLNDVKFIIESCLLTITKESLPTRELTLCERTSHQPIIEMGFVRNKAKFLIKSTQKSLSALSCTHIQSEASKLKNLIYSALLKPKFDAHERCYLPQYLVAKVILKRLLDKKRPVLVKITRHFQNKPFDSLNLMFTPNMIQADFEYNPNYTGNNDHCFVAAGIVNYHNRPEVTGEYINRLLSYSILDIILANFASHPQYAGELKELPPPFSEVRYNLEKEKGTLQGEDLLRIQEQIDQINVQETDYKNKKQFAIKHGCALENPSLLFLNHIYSDRMIN